MADPMSQQDPAETWTPRPARRESYGKLALAVGGLLLPACIGVGFWIGSKSEIPKKTSGKDVSVASASTATRRDRSTASSTATTPTPATPETVPTPPKKVETPPKPVAKKKADPDPEKPFVTESFNGLRAGATQWDKNGKKWDGSANAGLGGTGYNSRTRDWPAGSGAGAGGGGGAGGGTYWGSNGPSDPYDYNGRGQSGGGVNGDNFDPADVFESSGGDRGVSAPNEAVEPSADPDIPTSAQRGIRSRTSSVLRATPKTRGPTALLD